MPQLKNKKKRKFKFQSTQNPNFNSLESIRRADYCNTPFKDVAFIDQSRREPIHRTSQLLLEEERRLRLRPHGSIDGERKKSYEMERGRREDLEVEDSQSSEADKRVQQMRHSFDESQLKELKMKFLSSVGIGLSVVFCCLLLALFAETYYLLWWKRRITIATDQIQDDNRKKKPSSLMPTTQTSYEPRITEESNQHESETGFGFYSNNIDLYLKAIDENCMEAGLMLGPPRFLFTIKEETKEDLESEERRANGVSRRLSDLMRNENNTLLSSSTFFTPPLTPSIGSSHSHGSSIGYNPFHESSTDVEFNMMRPSPPPKFKFLRDAEKKLLKKNAMEYHRSKLIT
ncbi:hypothetical protein V2J09_002465 [Rumex salicifolius]